jgi:hypothetical protein
MRKLTFILGIATVAFASFTAPSLATEQNAAVSLCKKAGNCSSIRVPGGMTLWGSNSGGSYEIYCPDNGPCVVVSAKTTAGASDTQSPMAAPIVRDMRTKAAGKPHVYVVTSVEQVLRLKYKRNRHSPAPMEGPSPNQSGGGVVLAPAAPPTGTSDIIL